MATYKNKLQEYTQKLHMPMPVYETVNEGFDHLPSFKCFVTVDGLRYGSSGSYAHKKDAEQSAAQVAIQDLASKDSNNQFEEVIGKKLLRELLETMGIGSPTYSSTITGLAHSRDITTTVQIGELSYVGGIAKTKREAESKAAFVAFQAIKEQIGDPQFLLQLQAESRVNHELKQSTEECKGINLELRTITNSYPCNKILVGNNRKQTENSCELSIMENASAVEKGPGNLNANDGNSALSIEPHNPLEQENLLILPEQEETEAQKQGVQEVNLSAVEKGPGNSNANDENSAPSIEPYNQQEETEAQKQGVQEVNLSAVEKGPGNSNANDENSAPSIEPHNQLEQENLLILPKQEVNFKDSISKRSRSDDENCEQISGKTKKEKK